MDKKKISAACATAATLAALLMPGSAVAADGTLTLNAGEGSTLAGHSFTVYKLANYTDVVEDGANVKSVSAKHPDQTTGDWIAAVLKANGVSYSVNAGQNAAEQLLRLKTDTDTLRKVANTLQNTAAARKVTAVKSGQTSNAQTLKLTLPEGYYLVVDTEGSPDPRVHHHRRRDQDEQRTAVRLHPDQDQRHQGVQVHQTRRRLVEHDRGRDQRRDPRLQGHVHRAEQAVRRHRHPRGPHDRHDLRGQLVQSHGRRLYVIK